MRSPITIKEISSISGYSISTVSKALNDRYEIRESTKEKIRKIARSNNYIPNSTARALRNKRSNIIAVVVPKITSSYFTNFICCLQKKASQHQYRVMIAQSFGNSRIEKESILQMNDGTVDAIILLSNNSFMNLGLEDEILKNVLVSPYQKEKESEINKEVVKKIANSCFENALLLARKL